MPVTSRSGLRRSSPNRPLRLPLRLVLRDVISIPMARLGVLMTAVLSIVPTARLDADDLATPEECKQLSDVAEKIAKGGRHQEVVQLIDILLPLGLDRADATSLASRCNSALAKSTSRKSKLTSEAKALRKIAAGMTQRLPQLEGEDRSRLAGWIVKLDASQDAAQAALGRVLVDGLWRPQEAPLWEARRSALEEGMRRARHLAVEVRLSECDDELAVTLLGPGARTAQCGNVVVHSRWSDEKLTRTLQESMRALAWLQWGITGELVVPPLTPTTWIAVPSMETYRRAIAIAVKRGLLRGNAAANASQLTGWQVRPDLSILFRHTEVSLETSFLSRFLDDLSFGEPSLPLITAPPTLRAAIENWLCLSWFGSPMIGRVIFDSGEIASPPRPTGSQAPIDRTRAEELDQLMRMSRAGIVGVRSWMAYLASRGEDPKWRDTMVDHLGKLNGESLLKSTLVFEYLVQNGAIESAFGRMMKARGEEGKQPERLAAFADCSLEQLERDWHEWIVPIDRGLAARLDGEGGSAASEEGVEALAHLNQLRREAHSRLKLDAPREVSLDDELSLGCLAHAKYLNIHPKQAFDWPGIHEELPDHDGFSTAGAWGGAHGLVATRAKSGVVAIDAWMAGFYHRLPLLAPGIVRIGYGAEKATVVLDVKSLVAPMPDPWLVVWPPHQGENIPRGFSPELPNPVPGEDQKRFGYCVTVQRSARFKDDTAAAVSFVLREKDGSGEIVDAYLISPDEPLNSDLAPADAWGLIPQQRLDAKTTYHATFSIEGEKGVMWTFTTGSR